MNTHKKYRWWMAAIMIVGLTQMFGGRVSAVLAEPQDEVSDEAGVEVLTRGPVHEAFAEAISLEPQAGIVVPRMPPEAIEEIPPDHRPAGDNVAWIPGYWAWDDDRSDFVWVSGVWRAIPPGRQWVPGYWSEVPEGAQWTSGYWADATHEEIQYLPEPPASVEAGPSVEAPEDDMSWIPGAWVWNDDRYAWRPGYWAPVDPDWIWVPAHYVWTPLGYIFVDGYWDYAIDRRGMVFAPVFFDNQLLADPGFYYTPTTVINPAVFATHLFVRPNYCHYYFGDYYAPSYSQSGFYPWFAYNHRHYGYDPIYAHQRWEHRHDRNWDHEVHSRYEHWRDHAASRPPRTWADQQDVGRSQINRRDQGIVVAAPLSQLARSAKSPLELQPLDKAERSKLTREGRDYQHFRTERLQREMHGANRPDANALLRSGPVKQRLPSSPIVGQAPQRLGKNFQPPKTPQAPKLDHRVKPDPRTVYRPPGLGDDVRDGRKPGDGASRIQPRATVRPGDPRIPLDEGPKNVPPGRARVPDRTPAPKATTPKIDSTPLPKALPPRGQRAPQLQDRSPLPQQLNRPPVPGGRVPMPPAQGGEPDLPRANRAPQGVRPQGPSGDRPVPRAQSPQGVPGARTRPQDLAPAPRAIPAPQGVRPQAPSGAPPASRLNPPQGVPGGRVQITPPRSGPPLQRTNPAPQLVRPQAPSGVPPVPRVNPPQGGAPVPRANPAPQAVRPQAPPVAPAPKVNPPQGGALVPRANPAPQAVRPQAPPVAPAPKVNPPPVAPPGRAPKTPPPGVPRAKPMP